MDDEGIVALFFARNEAGIAEAGAQYGRYCYAVARRIVPSHEDAEECVSETWLRAWNAIPPQRPRALRLFLGRITRNIALNRLAALRAGRRGGGEAEAALEELEEVVGADAVEEATEAGELERCVAAFLEGLPERNRTVFLRRYYHFETAGEIARRTGLREANVLMILSRVRAALRTYLQKEGYAL